jgi:ClpX C4-type zinc finger
VGSMPRRLHCSFCGKSDQEVARLAAGPAGLHICDGCVMICQQIMDGSAAMPREFDAAQAETDHLLRLLKPLDETIARHRAHLEAVVDILRARGVPWSQIAAPLGVSRQAAHERFG